MKKDTIQSVADRDQVDALFVISNAEIREGSKGAVYHLHHQ
ncbi:hypothetical protein [Methanogenium cariaci]|nr:hypothetical protein [Methanogenium cariaci]